MRETRLFLIEGGTLDNYRQDFEGRNGNWIALVQFNRNARPKPKMERNYFRWTSAHRYAVPPSGVKAGNILEFASDIIRDSKLVEARRDYWRVTRVAPNSIEGYPLPAPSRVDLDSLRPFGPSWNPADDPVVPLPHGYKATTPREAVQTQSGAEKLKAFLAAPAPQAPAQSLTIPAGETETFERARKVEHRMASLVAMWRTETPETLRAVAADLFGLGTALMAEAGKRQAVAKENEEYEANRRKECPGGCGDPECHPDPKPAPAPVAPKGLTPTEERVSAIRAWTPPEVRAKASPEAMTGAATYEADCHKETSDRIARIRALQAAAQANNPQAQRAALDSQNEAREMAGMPPVLRPGLELD